MLNYLNRGIEERRKRGIKTLLGYKFQLANKGGINCFHRNGPLLDQYELL